MAKHRLLIDPPAAGPWNMAVDEALLIDAAESGVATLRLYQWQSPTLSLGYFQAYEERSQHSASRECACVRRQTGGGAIVHDREITYSVALPPDHPHSSRCNELYTLVHEAFIESLAIATIGSASDFKIRRLTDSNQSVADRPGFAESSGPPFLCFERRTAGDVVVLPRSHVGAAEQENRDSKILGSAQRRTRGALLQHGSLLLRKSPAAPELPGYYDLAGEPPEFDREKLVRRLEMAMGLRFYPGELPPELQLMAGEMANHKYGAASWTKRR